jgi:hypothetical protein
MDDMAKTQAWSDQLSLRLDERVLCGFARVEAGGELRVFVPFTSLDLTRAALRKAAELTRSLGAHITLFAVQVVPFPLPLDRPPVSPKFLENRLTAVALEVEAQVDVHTVLTRDLDAGFARVLAAHSLLVMATKKRWWPTAEMKLTRSLVRAGHSVALLEV